MDEAVLWLEAEVAQRAAGGGERLIVGQDHAAFAGSDVLVRVEAEGADVAKTSARAAAAGLAVHLGGIFDHFETMAAGDVEHRIDIHRQTIELSLIHI